MTYQPWTGAEIRILRDLRSEGYTLDQMARRLNRTRGSVGAQVARLGLPLHHDKQYRRRGAA